MDLPFHLQGERLPAILGIGVSRHSSLPAASANCRADDPTERPVESASLPLEQWLPSGAVESGDSGFASRTGLRGQGGCKLFCVPLVCFNNVKLPDDEALQQDNTATSAMRVKRSFDCLVSKTDTSPFQVKLRMAGPGFGCQLVAPGPYRRKSIKWSWPRQSTSKSGVFSGMSPWMQPPRTPSRPTLTDSPRQS